jgi:hypothetical protein
MQQKPDFLFIVTPQIKPVFMLESTIHHWELLPNLQSKIYSVIRKKDASTGEFYWDVQEAARPRKNIIPLNAIVILSKPDSIVLPLGITLTPNNPQLVLPSLYAHYSLNRVSSTLEALKIKNFFGPIKYIYKKYDDKYYATKITTRPIAK